MYFLFCNPAAHVLPLPTLDQRMIHGVLASNAGVKIALPHEQHDMLRLSARGVAGGMPFKSPSSSRTYGIVGRTNSRASFARVQVVGSRPISCNPIDRAAVLAALCGAARAAVENVHPVRYVDFSTPPTEARQEPHAGSDSAISYTVRLYRGNGPGPLNQVVGSHIFLNFRRRND
jgi:hypothetical protein